MDTQRDRSSKKERRQFQRLPMLARVTFSIPGSPQRFEGITQNISSSGLLFQTREHLAPETFLELSIQDRQGMLTPFKATGTVVRVEKNHDKAYYQIATLLMNVR